MTIEYIPAKANGMTRILSGTVVDSDHTYAICCDPRFTSNIIHILGGDKVAKRVAAKYEGESLPAVSADPLQITIEEIQRRLQKAGYAQTPWQMIDHPEPKASTREVRRLR